jgi:S-methylmethionine-dependent homocysteine/selenocysteine methylase
LANFVSKNTVVAAIIGSISASLACEYDGNVPVQLNHFKSRLEQIEQNLGY